MVGWASGPGWPKKEGGEGLISESRAAGVYASYFFFLCERTCIQDASSGS